jgi:hypothetical protein
MLLRELIRAVADPVLLSCSQFISSNHIGAITSFIFNYYDLPEVLEAEVFVSFGQLLTGASPSVLKSALLEFTSKAFAGRCRVRSLWNLLRGNSLVIVPRDMFPLLEVSSATSLVLLGFITLYVATIADHKWICTVCRATLRRSGRLTWRRSGFEAEKGRLF